MKRFFTIIFCVLFLAVVMTAAEYVAKTTSDGLPLEEDFWITSSELDQILQQTLENLRNQGHQVEKYFDSPYIPSTIGISSILIDFLFEEKIIDYFAVTNDLLPTEEEIAAETNELMSFYMADENMMLQIQMMYGSVEQFEALIRDYVIEMIKYEKISEYVVDISEDALKSFFSENHDAIKSQLDYVSAKHILVESEAEADELKLLIEEGSITFENAAQEHSLDTETGKAGGDLGFFGRGQMVESFEAAAFDAPVGVIVGPVESQFGYHLILVQDRFVIESFDELEPGSPQYEEFISLYRQERFEDWLSEYKAENDFGLEVVDPDIALYEEYVDASTDPSMVVQFRESLKERVFFNGLIDPEVTTYSVALFVQISSDLDMIEDVEYVTAVNHLYEILPESEAVLNYALELHHDNPDFMIDLLLVSLRDFVEVLQMPGLLEDFLLQHGEEQLMASVFSNIDFFTEEFFGFVEQEVDVERLEEYSELLIKAIDLTTAQDLSEMWMDTFEAIRTDITDSMQ